MESKATTKSVSLYPQELEIIEKVQSTHGYRKLSQAIQHIINHYGKNDVKLTPKGA